MAEVAVEVCTVRLLEAGAEAEVGQLDVAAGVQQKIVRFDVSARKVLCENPSRRIKFQYFMLVKCKVWRMLLDDFARDAAGSC